MAPSRRVSIIIIDDDDDVEIIGSGPSLRTKGASPREKTTYKGQAMAHPYDPCNEERTSSVAHRTSSSSSDGFSMYGHSPFRPQDWISSTELARKNSSITSRIKSQNSSRASKPIASPSKRSAFALSPSPMSRNRLPSIMIGIANAPIEIIEDENFGRESGKGVSSAQVETRRSNLDRKYSLFSHNSQARRQSFIDLEDDENLTGSFGFLEGRSALARSLRRHPTDDDSLIEVDILEQSGVPGLGEQDVYVEDDPQNSRRNSSKAVRIPRRNPTLVGPFIPCEQHIHHGLPLRANKTVELQDGDFLRIKTVIVNSQTKEVKLRGYRLQRVKDLNGMLEKKLNEVLLFYEVDLDDPREPSEQAAVEVPLAEIVRMRNVRFTNQKFPLCRNVNPSEFRSRDMASEYGGLTARWKYTCSYATADHRQHNKYKERTLERIKPHEAQTQFAVSEPTRRFGWRGETVSGGTHRPTVDSELDSWQRYFRAESPISIASSPKPGHEPFIRIHSPQSLMFAAEDATPDILFLGTSSAHGTTKRKLSSEFGPRAQAKRLRPTNGGSVEEARRQLSRGSLQIEKCPPRNTSSVIILSDDTPVTRKSSSFPQIIDMISSDLSSPPEMGEIQSKTLAPQVLITRLAGQKYTYGDAFSGAGGTTRGATMAGLKIKWGFDFSPHACGTWRQNFPNSICYHLDANAFIQVAKGAEAQGFPDAMKVDILHLSPPCQFFSPAHTVDGVDDEMNVASLFAVQSVIETSRARVVTLEQTFGIACPRFRFYFNALIQMFTIHDFSVRWSVVSLAQWGLPQRRQRLIIIASCPGEVLPRMPLPTHSLEGTGGLKPYVSVADTLASIPANAPDHDPNSLIFADGRRMRPWDATKILPRAMTTSGGQNYHPSGERDFTLREYAALQGFPPSHVFTGSYVKKQIGNAVPPCVAKVLFESIKRDLEKADGIIEAPELIE